MKRREVVLITDLIPMLRFIGNSLAGLVALSSQSAVVRITRVLWPCWCELSSWCESAARDGISSMNRRKQIDGKPCFSIHENSCVSARVKPSIRHRCGRLGTPRACYGVSYTIDGVSK